MTFRQIKPDFFFVWSAVFLLIVIIGFLPSFILRPVFTDTSIPGYLTVHGILMIAWFVGFFIQNLLMARGDVIPHKRYGIFWFILAILLSITNLNVIVAISGEVMGGEQSYYEVTRTVENTGKLALGNLYLTLSSSFLILFGYLKRKTPHIHKRALFGASFLLLAPALDRFMRPFNLEDIHPILNFLIFLYIVPISLIIHDFVKSRKLYGVSLIALVALILAIPIIVFATKYHADRLLIELVG